jgi:hypothetical protein
MSNETTQTSLNSDKEIPKSNTGLLDKYKSQPKQEIKRLDENNIGSMLDQLPEPSGCKDKDKFETGPWCKEKDWVIFARYAGSRLPIEGGEVRLLNDDEVLGTVKDPESVLHYI